MKTITQENAWEIFLQCIGEDKTTLLDFNDHYLGYYNNDFEAIVSIAYQEKPEHIHLSDWREFDNICNNKAELIWENDGELLVINHHWFTMNRTKTGIDQRDLIEIDLSEEIVIEWGRILNHYKYKNRNQSFYQVANNLKLD